jgi:hypothetical protein
MHTHTHPLDVQAEELVVSSVAVVDSGATASWIRVAKHRLRGKFQQLLDVVAYTAATGFTDDGPADASHAR